MGEGTAAAPFELPSARAIQLYDFYCALQPRGVRLEDSRGALGLGTGSTWTLTAVGSAAGAH